MAERDLTVKVERASGLIAHASAEIALRFSWPPIWPAARRLQDAWAPMSVTGPASA
jgi:hypothetical protein